MPRISKKAAAERRDRLIAVAREAFVSKGYDHTTIKDITDRLSLATGTFYYHFKSKEEVLAAVSEALIEDEAKKLEKISCLADQPIAGRLVSALRVMYETFWNNKHVWQMILQPHNVALHNQIFCAAITRLSPFLVAMIREGNEGHVFDVPYPEEMAETILSLLDLHVRQYCSSTTESRKDRLRGALEHTLKLILGEKCRPSFSFAAS